MNKLRLANRQRAVRVDTRLLRQLISVLVVRLLRVQRFDLGIYLVSSRAIAKLNEQFLNHAGPTDVISFDYADAPNGNALYGELFICPAEAVAQAVRFNTTWQSELARYIVHGLLHLLGYDDAQPGDRRKMKRREYRLLTILSRQFHLCNLGGQSRFGI